MRLSPPTQNRVATQIANYIRLTTIGYGAVATHVGAAGHPEAAVVAIAETGQTDCTAKVAVYQDRIAYTSATGTHVTYPTRPEDAGRIVCTLLCLEND
jgi:hypothetical protein